MSGSERFRTDAKECLKSNTLAVSDDFEFSDFKLDSEKNTLSFKWTSLISKNTCSFNYVASEKYPDLHNQEQTSTDKGEQHENDSKNRSSGDKEKKLQISAGSTVDSVGMIRTEESDILLPSGDSDEGSESEGGEGEDYYDYDPSKLSRHVSGDTEPDYSEEEEEEFTQSLSLHPLLKQDIESFRRLFEPAYEAHVRKEIFDYANEGKKHAKVVPSLYIRSLPALEEVDCDLHIPLNDLDISPQTAQAWGLNLDEPLIVRINVSATSYLNERDPPKVEVFQVNQKEHSIAKQLKNIITLFLRQNWSTMDNSFVQLQKAKKSTSMPSGLSLAHGGDVDMDLKALERLVEMGFGVTESRAALAETHNNLMDASLLLSSWGDMDVNVNTEALEHLVEMGFGEAESRAALVRTQNNLMDASLILSSCDQKPEEETPSLAHESTLSSTTQPKEKRNSTLQESSKEPLNKKPSIPRESKLPLPSPKKPKQKDVSTAQGPSKRHRSTPVKTHSKKTKNYRRTMSSSHTEPSLSEDSVNPIKLKFTTLTDSKKIPSLEDGFLVLLYRYLRQRVPSVSDFCVICDNHHVFHTSGAMLKPAVCSRELCLFSFQTLGVMAGAVADIATDADVVDLLITLAKAACFSQRRAIIFEPYPNIVDHDHHGPGKLALTDQAKDFKKVEDLMEAIPVTLELVGSSPSDLQKKLDQKDRLLYPLLCWIITSNRSHIIKLPKDKQLKTMSTPHQFILLSSPPAQEKIFQAAKEKHGSRFAFHGSDIGNWHSIIRQGLIVASGTKYQMHGAANGKGIYLSPVANVSAQYAKMGDGTYYLSPASQTVSQQPRKRFLRGTNVTCIALCEVINSASLRKQGSIWVCPEKDHVCTRFFFLYKQGQIFDQTVVRVFCCEDKMMLVCRYEKGQIFKQDVDMNCALFQQEVEKALADCFMAVVPESKASTQDI
ncbi:hypothetical protein ACOMHN_011220 [Nucella lapillus]